MPHPIRISAAELLNCRKDKNLDPTSRGILQNSKIEDEPWESSIALIQKLHNRVIYMGGGVAHCTPISDVISHRRLKIKRRDLIGWWRHFLTFRFYILGHDCMSAASDGECSLLLLWLPRCFMSVIGGSWQFTGNSAKLVFCWEPLVHAGYCHHHSQNKAINKIEQEIAYFIQES